MSSRQFLREDVLWQAGHRTPHQSENAGRERFWLTSQSQIVDKKSATLNLPGTREKQVAMHSDHSSICKFDSASNPACELAIGTIATELECALELERL